LNQSLIVFSSSKKKVSDLMSVSIETEAAFINGFFIADKVGEVKFINIENLGKLKNEDEENQKVTKLLFGH
jgi:alkyl hydroperoxide reductase subunit AhpC